MSRKRNRRMESNLSMVALYSPKCNPNFGAILRNCTNFGVSCIFVIKSRLPKKIPQDVTCATKKIPVIYFETFEELKRAIPEDCCIAPIEITEENCMDIREFQHPKKCIYVFGPEDGSLPKEILNQHKTVFIPTKSCLNLGTTSGIVLYDRLIKQKTSE